MEPFILVAILFLGVWFFAKQTSTADAAGHCGAQTMEQGQKLSYDELVTLAQNAGFSCDAPIAAAIAMAESSGNPTAYNPESQVCTAEGQGSYGLWQIYLTKHPEYSCNPQALFDPQTNANEAFKVYSDAGGFSPWSTYKNGKYQDFLA